MARMPQYPLFANVAGMFFIHRTNIYQDPTTLVRQMEPPASAREMQAGDLGPVLVEKDTVEEEMATHCTIFAWKSLWMETQATVHGVAKSQTLPEHTLHFTTAATCRASHGGL